MGIVGSIRCLIHATFERLTILVDSILLKPTEMNAGPSRHGLGSMDGQSPPANRLNGGRGENLQGAPL